MQHSGITLLGLGPGDPAHLTLEAWQIIAGASEIWLRTRQHPTVAGFPDSANLYSFDDVYDQAADFETVYQTIIEQVLKLGRRLEGVIYAVPGHPFIAETTGPEIRRRAKADNIPVRVIQGLSFLEPLQTVLGLDPFPQTLLVDAFEIASSHQLPYSPHHPAIIAQIHNRSLAADLKLTLMTHFPDEHVVKLVHAAGTSQESVERLMLWQIDQSEKIGLLTALYVPALSPDSGLPALAEIVAQLRAPDGCPWDQEQTHESMRPHLIEEAYEVLDAIDHGDPAMLAEELGDLLFQVVFPCPTGQRG